MYHYTRNAQHMHSDYYISDHILHIKCIAISLLLHLTIHVITTDHVHYAYPVQ